MRFRLSRAAKVSIGIFIVLGVLGSVVIVVPLLMVMSTTAATTPDDTSQEAVACGPVVTTGGRSLRLSSDQIANARTVITTGQELGVPGRGLVVAIATSLQESTLRNLSWGDRDSVGLFQQRNAWGSTEERTDPATAATLFYTGGRAGQPGLLDIRGWATMPVTTAAQSVQRSAYPLAYAKWEPLATTLVQSVVGKVSLGCSDPTTAGLPSGAVGAMLRAALNQQGDPYVWGAVGPDAFDCSGLVVYSWRQAGYRVAVRTAAQMYARSDLVDSGQERPGDLLFGDFGPGGPGHVMIVVRPGQAVQAPETGRNVELTTYRADGSSWRLARLRSTALLPV
jgi:cell wall-associated NlpC family hydrolase